LKWWCGPFTLGLIFSPPLALIAKNGDVESPFIFSPLIQVNKSEGLYQLRVEEQRQRVNDTVRDGVEALSLPKTPFSFQSMT
jgi:hypothetical protein